MIPIQYNRRVTIQRQSDGVATDNGYGNAGVFTNVLTNVPCNIEQEIGSKASVYDGTRFTANGVARFQGNLDIRVGDYIADGSRLYEITRSHPVFAAINIPTYLHCEWREVQR